MSIQAIELAALIQSTLAEIHSQQSSNESRSFAQKRLDESLIEVSHLVIPSCLIILSGRGDSVSCHFALSTMSKYIAQKSHTLSELEWSGLKSGLLGLFQGAQSLPYFVMSKLLDVICDVAIRTWPSDWPELFPATVGSSNRWGICLFARICDSLSEDALASRCIAPERQLSLRTGIASIHENLVNACTQVAHSPEGSSMPGLQWTVELIKGMVTATKQSSFILKQGLHQILLRGFVDIPDPTMKMLCVETLSYCIHFLNGQSGRSYVIPRGTREQDLSLLEGIIKTCDGLLERGSLKSYCEDEELRDSVRSFFELLTDIRKTPNIFSYFPDLSAFCNILVKAASVHPSLHVQVTAMGNVDALIRSKHTTATRDILLLCFLGCHDFFTPRELEEAPIPSATMFPHLGIRKEITKRRELCESECEDEGLKPAEMFGKLKNAALMCVRHIATIAAHSENLMVFLREVLNETIRPGVGVAASYHPALLFTEAVATAIPFDDPKRGDLSQIVDIVSSQFFSGREQDYLWFIGKAGALISGNCLKSVFEIILKMDIANNFPVQVAFISLCKHNSDSSKYVADLYQALQGALGGESRSWAIGAILSASSHGGVGSADGFAINVFRDAMEKMKEIAAAYPTGHEDFSKRSTPLFATLKAVLEVPLSPAVSVQIASEIATQLIPLCWTRLTVSPSLFDVGPNEYLSVLGAQFLQGASATALNMNAAFQMFLQLTQVGGLCLSICPEQQASSISALLALFDPSWRLRPSLINVLVSTTAAQAAASRSLLVCKSVIPGAIASLENAATQLPNDEFTVASFGKATASIVSCLLSALQITTDDEFVVSEFTGAAKPTLTNRQLKTQLRTRNRFTGINEESTAANSPQPMGHRIPRILLAEPEVALSVVSKCLLFRSDKALRRISQSVPTILTRWWNSVSHDAHLSSQFVSIIPELLLKPILHNLLMVRNRDPVTLTGGQLHSYTVERAVSGRRLASEQVDHASTSIHGVLSILWRFGSSHMGGNTVDPIAVATAFPPLGQAMKMLLDATRSGSSNELATRILACAKEQSLESRATLKFIVESVTKEVSDQSQGLGVERDIIAATSRDISTTQQIPERSTGDESVPPGYLFDH